MIKTTMPSIVLTRPKAAAERFGQKLREVRPEARVIVSPVLSISYRANVVLPAADQLVFTSVHGVEGYARLGGAKKPAYCVGERTAEAARILGCEILAIKQNSAELETVLSGASKLRILHLRGEHVAGQLAERVANLAEAVVYEQPVQAMTPEALKAFSGESAVVLPLFSPRTARELAKQIKPLAPLHAAFMSDSVKERFKSVALEQAAIAPVANAKAMFELTVALFDAACALEGRGQGD